MYTQLLLEVKYLLFVLMIGVGLVSVPAGLVASSLKKARDLEDEERNS